DHDKELLKGKTKTAAGGFAIAFDPHVLTADNNLLNTPRPVYPKLKVKDKEFKLRDQAVTCYSDSQFPDPKPNVPQPGPGDKPAAAKELVGYLEVTRDSETDKLNSWSKAPFPTRKLSALTGAVSHRLV